MTSPSPRPTREQVDADLASLAHRRRGASSLVDLGHRLAAEVRALRVELTEIREAAGEHRDVSHEDLLSWLRRLTEIDDERYAQRHRQ